MTEKRTFALRAIVLPGEGERSVSAVRVDDGGVLLYFMNKGIRTPILLSKEATQGLADLLQEIFWCGMGDVVPHSMIVQPDKPPEPKPVASD